jgi:hypothetical protein
LKVRASKEVHLVDAARSPSRRLPAFLAEERGGTLCPAGGKTEASAAKHKPEDPVLGAEGMEEVLDRENLRKA